MEFFEKYKTKHSLRQKPSMENWSPVKVWQNCKWRNFYSLLFSSDPKKLPGVSSLLRGESGYIVSTHLGAQLGGVCIHHGDDDTRALGDRRARDVHQGLEASWKKREMKKHKVLSLVQQLIPWYHGKH